MNSVFKAIYFRTKRLECGMQSLHLLHISRFFYFFTTKEDCITSLVLSVQMYVPEGILLSLFKRMLFEFTSWFDSCINCPAEE